MEVFRSEVKVGLFILVSFVLLLVGVFLVSDIRSFFDERKSFTLLFPYADGITRGSPVWYAGYAVGEVSDIQIAQGVTDRIALTVKIDPKARVRKDSHVEIRNLGMMGAKYVEISPGSPDAPELASGESLEGGSPSSISEIMETGQKVAARLLALVVEAQGLVQDIRGDAAIKDTMQNANALITELREQNRSLKPILAKFDTFAASLTATGENLKRVSGDGGKEFTALLKDLRDTNASLQKRLDVIEGQLTKTLGSVDRGFSEAEGTVKGIHSVVASSEGDIAQLLTHLTETAKNLDALSEDLRAHPWKVVWKKDGALGQTSPVGSEQWRDKGRIGPNGKE